ncbi:MAG: 2-C-methyl-D-erythritol 4-phosphate cytidylyltransferase [Methanobrevibacter sp.]|nr:2-C-methyl-D-erythritol 4-phosphate cytidylyltransferase [Methanobrevibacter sp.]
MNYLLLMMGGSGTRLGADRPKQYIEIDGIPIFFYILRSYNKLDCIDEIIIVSNEMWIDYVQKWIDSLELNHPISIVAGGETRSHSVYYGLKSISDRAQDEDIVLFHDATHPYVDEPGTIEVIEAINEYGGATLGAFQYDTVYRMSEDGFITDVIPRQELVAGASPEGFKFGEIFPIYDKSTDEELESMTSGGALALEHGIKMKTIEANVINLKITYPHDLEIFKKTIHSYFFESQK